MEQIGILYSVGTEERVSEKFTKRTFVIRTVEQYPQFIEFQLSQDRCDLIDNYQAGDVVTVSFNLKGREWLDPKTGVVRYFNTLEAWKIQSDKPKQEVQAPQQQVQQSQPQWQPATAEPMQGQTDKDDLPF